MPKITANNTTVNNNASIGLAFWVVIGVLVLMALALGSCSGIKAFNRYQRRADVNNQVRVTETRIRIAKQQVQVQKQLANVRVAEADGIRRAQDKINKTLTPLYIQHEAIQAQLRVAESGKNNTIIYTPSGNNGVPLVQDISSANHQPATTTGKK